MAVPFGCMLARTHVHCFDSIYMHTRCFASRRGTSAPLKNGDQLHVKSFFEKQITGGKSETVQHHPSSYKALLDKRRDQALRSVLIRVHKSPQGVCDSLQTLGPINAAYTLLKTKNYLLVEFKHKETVDKLLQHVSYFPDARQIPVRSRLLYHMQAFHVQRHRPGSSVTAEVFQTRELTTEDYLAADSVSSQMKDLHSVQQLSEVGSRLRFLICSMVEDLVGSSLPFCRIDPFGSSSNGFGWEGCDLDMMMTMKPLKTQTHTGSKFRFLTKRGSDDDRVFGQQNLDVVGEMIRVFMPAAYGINKVLNARVPIVKFHHDATEIDCDLSYTNLSGAKMSELMFLLGETDPRVRVLMTTIKQWAKSCDVTRSHPGPWPANFTLLAMLIFFLQTRSPAVLPSVRHLQALAGPEDHFMIDDVDYAFITDVTKVSQSTNTQSLDELLQEFFHYYTHFDFAEQGLSLIEGSTFSKQNPSPMHIENPLDICHNIGKNVNSTYVTKLQNAMLEALQCIESKKVPNRNRPWGLFCLFQPASLSPTQKSYSVAGLFEEDGKSVDNEELGFEEVGGAEEGWEKDSGDLVEEQSEQRVVVDASRQKSTSEKGSAACL